ncbi:MAG: AAA family ATPase [Acidimicrobiales bacterium]
MALDARRALLLAWADLLPAPTESVRLVVAADDELVWLGAASSPFARGRRRFGVPSIGAARRLAQLDAMGGGEPVLREGWVFLVGTSEWGGELRDVVLPLVSRAVHLTSGSLAEKVLGVVGASPLAAGFSVIEADSEAELVGLVDDPRQRAELLDAAEGAAAVLVGGGFDLEDDPDLRPFRSWCRQVARAAGMRITAEAPFVHGEPHRQLGAVPPGRVRVVVGSGIYAAPATVRAPAASSLARWAALDDLASTAFGHLYPRRAEEDPALDAGPLPSGTVASAYPLTDAQAEVVLRARGAPLTVVSGAPGTGKTHTVAAVALDRAAAGASVLVATRTRAAARAVLEQLARVGVVAVSFGDPRHTEEESPHGDLEGRGHLEGRGALDKAVDRAEALRRTVLASLDRAAAGGQGSGPVRWDELAAAEGAVRAVAAREARQPRAWAHRRTGGVGGAGGWPSRCTRRWWPGAVPDASSWRRSMPTTFDAPPQCGSAPSRTCRTSCRAAPASSTWSWWTRQPTSTRWQRRRRSCAAELPWSWATRASCATSRSSPKPPSRAPTRPARSARWPMPSTLAGTRCSIERRRSSAPATSTCTCGPCPT